jgi:uncharacterized protein YndB with AHSA1/START domain
MTTSVKEPNSLTLTPTGEREIRIERIFNASRDRVWRAFTEPELVAQWWGRGGKLVVERLEIKRGGHWRFVVMTPGGPQGFEGRYREVKPQERIAWTFEWDGMPGHVAVDTVTFEDLGDGRTRMVNTSMFFTGQERDGAMGSGMEQGLHDSYAALDRLLATLD